MRLKINEGFPGERSIVLPKMIKEIEQKDPVLSQLYITDIGYYPHAAYHYRERTEPIDQYVLIYCIKGSGLYRVGSHSWQVKENQYFILPAGQPHAYGSDSEDPWTIYWVHFSGKMAPYYASPSEGPKDITPTLDSRITSRNEIFEDIFLALSDGYSIDNLRYSSSLLFGYLSTFRYLHLYRKYRQPIDRVETNDIIKVAINYMNENIEKPLSLKEISEFTGYSPSRFSAIFKSRTGHSTLNYFNQLKVNKACELLETTNMKINQICSKVGIDDNYYFSRLFTKVVGISPKQYRKKSISSSSTDDEIDCQDRDQGPKPQPD